MSNETLIIIINSCLMGLLVIDWIGFGIYKIVKDKKRNKEHKKNIEQKAKWKSIIFSNQRDIETLERIISNNENEIRELRAIASQTSDEKEKFDNYGRAYHLTNENERMKKKIEWLQAQIGSLENRGAQ